MEEVRSYWQVASIHNFCTLFQKPFRLPQFEPEELEQAFITDVPLLVELAIALLEPHFNSKITANNWEVYLKRIIEANWVDLEHHPSPFRVPFVSPEGVELTKHLNFNDLPLSDKIDLFSALCDYRFWCEDASEAIKDYPIEELRLEPIGKDQQGYEYWYFSGTRLFKEDKDLTHDLISRKKRIKELEYELIELEKTRIIKEQEEKKRAEIEQAKKLAQEAREARLATKKQQEQEQEAASKRRKRDSKPILPLRTGLRERRSSAASNNHEQQSRRQSAQKVTRSSTRGSKQNNSPDECPEERSSSPDLPKKSREQECKEEINKLAIKPEERKASWCIQCESLEEWENFVTKFERTKSTHEKYLYHQLNEFILPNVRAIYAKRAAEVRRKEKEMLLSLATRRVSTRIISKKAQEEEEERQAQLREAEIQKKKAEAEIRLRAELEREIRAKRNRFVINGEGSSNCSEDGEVENVGRYNLRQHDLLADPTHEFEGIIHPDKLSDFYEALELIIDTVRTSKHAWPFVDSVPETVPGYYDLIEEPMDLKKLRTKVEFREYKSLIEVERDFQLLVNNCERFNGPKNIYTKMVYKLWKSFRKNVQLYLQRDLHMNEYETFVYPPQPAAPPVQPAISPVQPAASPVQRAASPAQPAASPVQRVASPAQPAVPFTQQGAPTAQSVAPPAQLAAPPAQPEAPLPQPTTPLVQPTSQKLSVESEPPQSVLAQECMVQETIVEEIIYDTPDNEIYVWQDNVIQGSQ